MLVCAGQPVKQRRFPAVLVADQRKRQYGMLGQGMATPFGVILSSFAKTGMGGLALGNVLVYICRSVGKGPDFDFFGIRQSERQFIAMHHDFHWIAHWRQLHRRHLDTRDHAHIQKMLP